MMALMERKRSMNPNLVMGVILFFLTIIGFPGLTVSSLLDGAEDSLEAELLVRIAFAAYDTNQDGRASVDELVNYALGEQEKEEAVERLSKAEIRESVLEGLPEWDRDRNGYISFKELLAVAKA